MAQLCGEHMRVRPCEYCEKKEKEKLQEKLTAALAAKGDLEAQVKNLEEYMLKGVAFRDELQAQLCRAREALQYVAARGHQHWCPTTKNSLPEEYCECHLRVIRPALSSPSPCQHEVCDNCNGGCPDKDHPAVHHLCEECHQENVKAFNRIEDEAKRLRAILDAVKNAHYWSTPKILDPDADGQTYITLGEFIDRRAAG